MGTFCERGGAAGAASRTIYAAVEVSRKSWVVGLHAPNATGIDVRVIPAADVDALAGLIDRARARLERGRGAPSRVLCGYEAGYEGFWLSRRLADLRIEAVVLDAASLPVSRRAKRVKTDRVDAARMVRALMALDRDEPGVCSVVRLSSVEEEGRPARHLPPDGRSRERRASPVRSNSPAPAGGRCPFSLSPSFG